MKEILKQRYKDIRKRIDYASVEYRYKKLEEEKEIQRAKQIDEETKRNRQKKLIEDEIIRKFKIKRDYLLLNATGLKPEEMTPKRLEDEIEFWKKASKYIRGQSIPDAIRRIVAEVCIKHNQFLLDIESDRRTTDVMPARFELIYRLRTETTWSLPRIGRFLGNRDHTTILHGYQKFKKQLEKGEVSL